MALLVELDIFSGQPNPRWVLSGEQERDFRRKHMQKQASSLGDQPILGYRGFLVHETDPETFRTKPFNLLRYKAEQRRRNVRTAASGAAPKGTNKIAGAPALEEFLLATAGNAVDTELRQHVVGAIAEVPKKLELFAGTDVKASCPVCMAADAPAYNPSQWNSNPVLTQNNCYNYANNQITNTFAQPGKASGHPMTGNTCPGVQPSAQADGLVTTAGFSGRLTAGNGWYVALVIWPGRDFHWYRQDKVGCWSHKPGRTPATNKDSSGAAISDPQACNRGNYTVFCSYMITKSTVHIR
jgi:hypothetical protein